MNMMFQCPEACKQIYPFREIITHKQRKLCYVGYVRPKENPAQKKLQPKPIAQSQYMPEGNQSLAQQLFAGSAAAPALPKLVRPSLKMIHILQKDSKNILAVDLTKKTAKIVKGKTNQAFPHNFQVVNGSSGQLYMVGGGDYQKDEESLYNLWEVQVGNGYNFIKRDSMKHPRHGHSAIWFGSKFIVVTGSRKEKNDSQSRCEMYNSDIDLWFEMPNLNVGRHYHSSCQFSERFIYIFCGIANKTRKYINSLEVYDHNSKKAW